jgi:hypothetical protein
MISVKIDQNLMKMPQYSVRKIIMVCCGRQSQGEAAPSRNPSLGVNLGIGIYQFLHLLNVSRLFNFINSKYF